MTWFALWAYHTHHVDECFHHEVHWVHYVARGQSEDLNHRDENVVVQKEPVQYMWGCLYYGMLIRDLIFNNLEYLQVPILNVWMHLLFLEVIFFSF